MADKRIALVTGANQGVGLQVAKELVANGVTVLVGARNFERGEAAAREIGAGTIALQLDVTDRVSIAEAVERSVWPLVEAGKVRPVIYARFPLAHASDAHRLMESGRHIGKIVLIP